MWDFRQDDFETANRSRSMITRRTIIGLLASTGALGLAGCGGGIDKTIRYRLKLDIETPEGLRSGASVIEVRFSESNGYLTPPEARGSRWSIKGEAVVVDLGSHGLLFGLLKGDPLAKGSGIPPAAPDAAYFFTKTFHAAMPGDVNPQRFDEWAAHKGALDMQPIDRPMLVRFRDIADPKTVERVDPENLAASFGPGVKFSHATIEIVDDAVTTGIEKRLGWLGEYPEPSLAPVSDPFRDPAHPPFAATVHHGDFRRGLQ